MLKRYESDFVQSIRSVGDQFSDEDFLLGVEGVNDDIHEPGYISIEGVVFLGSLYT